VTRNNTEETLARLSEKADRHAVALDERLGDISTLKELLSTSLKTSHQYCNPIATAISSISCYETFLCTWEMPFMGYFRMTVCVTGSRIGRKTRYNVLLRWTLGRWMIVTCRMRFFWPLWSPPLFGYHAIIPRNSAIVEACCSNDLSAIQCLFASGDARPNDTTDENLTLLRVSLSILLLQLDLICISTPLKKATLRL